MGTPAAEEDAAAALEAGRKLFAGECRFVAGAFKAEQIPPGRLPEVAFAGRSNVGKSSLINALTGRRTLARVSHTPGRTQQINFFDLGGRLVLADLPGYGYAAVSRKKALAWTAMANAYLKGRQLLRRVLLLVDGRHGLKDLDRQVMKMLDQAAVSYQIVLTKCDKIKPPELAERLAAATEEAARHVAAHPEVVPTSAAAGTGVPELRAVLAALAAPAQTG